MTAVVDIINRALQAIGTRTTITAAQLAAQSNNEAKQAALIYENTRDDLLRMAPWGCALVYDTLTYITSIPGTPENSSTATAVWQRGQPLPPWAYEYQYPVDCLKACYIVPQITTGLTTPIFPVATGIPAAYSAGPPVKYTVASDLFYPVVAASVVAGGSGYVVGDVITLASGATGSAPIGAPCKLQVTTVSSGAVLTATVISQLPTDSDETPSGGSYFAVQTNPVVQGSTTGSGTGATFNLTFGAQAAQRVILANQQNSMLVYIKRVTDPNQMDTLFQSAWTAAIAGQLAVALTGDKALANMQIKRANDAITEARVHNANESLTVNDYTPDFLRVRGVAIPESTVAASYDWGGLWPTY